MQPRRTDPAAARPAPAQPAAALLLTLYAALLAIGLVRHEIWRDEAQAWLLARTSASPAALLHAMRYEGHPAIWHLLLWGISRLVAAPWAMQALHGVLALVGVALFLRWAPFPLPLRGLLVLGYLPLFEYGVVSRNYVLALPLLWSICHLHAAARRRWVSIAVLLALLANCNPYAWLLTIALATALLPEAWHERSGRGRELFLAGATIATGLALALLQMMPPADAEYPPVFERWWGALLARTLGTALAGYLPLPDPRTMTPWNSALVYRIPAPLLAALALAAVLALALLLPRGTPRRLFVLGTGILFAFTYTRYIGWARHHGHHVLLLLACCWMAERGHARTRSDLDAAPDASAVPSPEAPSTSRRDRRRAARLVVLTAIAVVHLAAGAWLYADDLAGSFSGAETIAHWLARPPFAGLPAYGVPDPPLTAVAAFRDEPVLSLAAGKPVTYLVWRRDENVDLPVAAFCATLLPVLRAHPAGIALVLAPTYATRCDGARVTAALRTPRAIVPSERLLLWRVELAPGAPAASAARVAATPGPAPARATP